MNNPHLLACLLCSRLLESRKFSSSLTGLTYFIRHHLTCKSSYVIYLVTCLACSAQYVGKTTEPMHKRHTGHRRGIEDESTPLGRHFARCGYNNLILQIIYCVREGKELALIQREGVWRNRLATFQVPAILNIRNEMKGKSYAIF